MSAPGAHAARDCRPQLDSLVSSMNNVTLNPRDGSVWATDNRWGEHTLVRLDWSGIQATPVHTFGNPIMGIHCTGDGTMFVSTDYDHRSPDYPCSLFRSVDGARSFAFVKELPTGAALWWSMAHDRDNHLYVGEYGPYAPGMANRVWKTTDNGDSWRVVFEAPPRYGIHIHRVAVDPYTNDVWVTHGDAEVGTYRSRDGGLSWSFVRASKATAAAFTEDAIYWGEDDSLGIVTRYDRKTGEFDPVLVVSQRGHYGGSVFDMTIGPSGQVYVPFKRYFVHSHVPSIWVGRDREWRLLQELEEPRTGASHITPPDRNGYMYFMHHRIREPCPPSRPAPPERLDVRASPNPAFQAGTVVWVALPVQGPATVEVLDVSGRRVLFREIGALGVGTHAVPLTGKALAPGIYVVRVRQAEAVGTTRLVVVR